MRNLMITDDQEHVEVRLAMDEQLEVAVPENAGTGFAWGASTGSDGVVEIVGEEFEAPTTPAAGAAGMRRFVVACRRAGQAVLTLELRRPWEIGDPARRVIVSMTVQAAQ